MKRWAPIAEMVAAIAVALWVSRAWWWPGGFVTAFDTVAYTAPNYEVTIASWRAGRLPLWNEFIFGGVTHLGNPQTGALSPTKVIGLIFDTHRALGVTVAAHLVLMAVGTVLLMRRLGVRPPFALVSAIVMVANGAVLTRSTQFEQIVVVAWLPLLLLVITAIIEAPDTGHRWARPWFTIAALAGVGALTLLAGHPQTLYQVLLVAVVWAIALLIARRAWTRLVDLAIGATTAILIAGLHLVAAAAAVADTAAGEGRTFEQLRNPALSTSPRNLPGALLGSIRGTPHPEVAGSFEGIAAVGAMVMVLSTIGVVAWWRHRSTRPLAVAVAGLAVISVIWALGPRTPVFRLAWELLPGFDLARASSRWLTVTAVMAAIATGVGLEALRRSSLLPAIERRWWRLGVVGIAAILVLEVAAIGRGAVINTERSSSRIDARVVDAAAALIDTSGLSVAFTDDRFDDADYLIAGLRPNTNVLSRIRSLDGYDGGVQITTRYRDLIESLNSGVDLELPLRNHLPQPLEPSVAASLGIRWVLIDQSRDASAILPRWLPTDASDDRAVDDHFAVFENPAWSGDALVITADGITAPVPLQHDTPTRLVVTIDADAQDLLARSGSTLVVQRQFAPGWEARLGSTVVGRDAIDDWRLGASGAAITAAITAAVESDHTQLGDQVTVVFEYRPTWVPIGMAMSIIGLLALGALVVAGVITRRRILPRGQPLTNS